jgi:hypothetical protein
MSIKFNYGNYTITADFKDDFNLSMTASDNFSGDYFLNEKVELNKIKKRHHHCHPFPQKRGTPQM